MLKLHDLVKRLRKTKGRRCSVFGTQCTQPYFEHGLVCLQSMQKAGLQSCVQCMHILILNSPLALLIDKRSWQTRAHLVERIIFPELGAGTVLVWHPRPLCAADTEDICGHLHPFLSWTPEGLEATRGQVSIRNRKQQKCNTRILSFW